MRYRIQTKEPCFIYTSIISGEGVSADFVGLFRLTSEEFDISERAVKIVWEQLTEAVKHSKYGPLQTVKNTLSGAEMKFINLFRTERSLAAIGIKFELSLLLIIDNSIYFATNSDHSVGVLRNGEWTDVATVLRKANSHSGSFETEPSDTIFLSTQDITNDITKNNFITPKIFNDITELLSPSSGLLIREPILEDILKSESDLKDEKSSARIKYQSDTLKQSSKLLNSELKKEKSNDSDLKEFKKIQEAVETQDSSGFKNNKATPTIKKKIETPISTSKMEPKTQTQIKKDTLIDKIKSTLTSYTSNLKRKESHQLDNKALDSNINKAKISPIKLKDNNVIQKLKQTTPYFTKFADSLGGFILKIITKIVSVPVNFIDSKFARNPKYREFKYRLSSFKINTLNKFTLPSEQNRNYGTLFIFIVVIALLFFGYKQASKAREEKKLATQIQTEISKLENQITTIEQQIRSNNPKVLTTIDSALNSINELSQLKAAEPEKKSIEEIKSKYIALEDRFTRTTVVSEELGNLDMYINTKLIDTESTGIIDSAYYRDSSNKEILFIVDNKSVYSIELYDKKITKIKDTNGLIKKPRHISVANIPNSSEHFGVIYDDINGFITFASKNGEYSDLALMATPKLDSGNNTTDFVILTGNSNFYLTNRTESALIRSLRGNNGTYADFTKHYSEPQYNTANSITADDYTVYIGSDDSNKPISRWSSGNLQESKLSTSYPALSNPAEIFTGSDMSSNFYIYDKSNKRILIYEKPDDKNNIHPTEFILLTQIRYRGNRNGVLENGVSISADQKEAYIYIADGEYIWRIKVPV